MDIKKELIDDNPLSDDISPQNEEAFFIEDAAVETNNDVAFLEDDCDIAVKIEIKSESSFSDLCSENERALLTEHLGEQSKVETLTSDINRTIIHKIDFEEETLVSVSDFGSQNETELLSGDPVKQLMKCNSDYEAGDKVEIKEELSWLKTETSFCSDIKDRDLHSVTSPGLCREADAGNSNEKSTLTYAEDLRKDISFYTTKNYQEVEHFRTVKCQESNVTELHREQCVHSEQSGKYDDGGNIYSMTANFKQNSLTQQSKKPHKCESCKKRFKRFSNLKRHNLIHEDKKPHKCDICEKRFSQLSNLKVHNLIHEGKKPYNCELCEKRFTQLSSLKRHLLIHEGEKPHKCEICEKNILRLPDLKRHYLIHEGKKSHKCEICEKRFIRSSDLKNHCLIHEGKRRRK